MPEQTYMNKMQTFRLKEEGENRQDECDTWQSIPLSECILLLVWAAFSPLFHPLFCTSVTGELEKQINNSKIIPLLTENSIAPPLKNKEEKTALPSNCTKTYLCNHFFININRTVFKVDHILNMHGVRKASKPVYFIWFQVKANSFLVYFFLFLRKIFYTDAGQRCPGHTTYRWKAMKSVNSRNSERQTAGPNQTSGN